MKFSFKDFFGKCDQIRRKQQIWSDLLKKSLMGNFIFSVVYAYQGVRNNSFTEHFAYVLHEWSRRRLEFSVLEFVSSPALVTNMKTIFKPVRAKYY